MKMKNLIMTTIAIFGLAIFTNAQVPNYVPSDGLVGWWPFNANANDESLNGNDGIVNGAILSADRFNSPNSAYNFNGTNLNQDFIIADNPISNADSFTISFWISRADSIKSMWSLMISNNDNFTGSYEFLCYQDTICFRNWAVGLNFDLKTQVANFNTTYFNICVTSYLSTSKLYLNGVLINQTNIAKIKPIQGNLFIGKHSNFPTSSNTSFNGRIDDIGIWNRVLTDEEITSIYYGSSVGINEVSQSNLFSVFPNPTQSEVNVKLDDKLVGSVFTIYDNIGKAVKTGKLNSVNTTIELNDLSGGIYTFSVGENKKQTFKVIKE
jgi:hypothetical protein